ncbi:hypothetical protein McanMca71_005274 [Microsporum canis]|uniref:Anaphase-promoting complex subunit 10 n=1 Tax=Arthroderma otae (strain ATCC MYA-4605 / CBS 113480) TaxID=554155 RepID=C5FBH3_ARTOC|nr:anaphase-promoting complex subunit 10 [Microsporum canis CBS 113480]EEQ27157.1 anaphase-promoting complex subunit 10 [Microsporum canis CBS 113480]
MPRRGPHAPSAAFPSGDGASVSTARIPQLLPSYTPQQRARGQQPVTPGSDEDDEEDEEDDPVEEDSAVEDDPVEDDSAVEGQSYEGVSRIVVLCTVQEQTLTPYKDIEDIEDIERHASAPVPPNLREISSLASWTVSTYKPGSGVAALRNPSPNQFWQSDGPQPHTLALHFFKRVSIVRIRVYLDFELDESYTPTKMVFLAGMGGNDLVEFATWQGETPCGWVDISLDGVGGRHQRASRPARTERRRTRKPALSDGSESDDETDSDGPAYDGPEDGDDPSDGNVLKLMVLQVKVCENHQNGKDTHVRGFQVFARDDRYYARMGRADNGQKLLHHDLGAGMLHSDDGEQEPDSAPRFDEEDWMMEPELR